MPAAIPLIAGLTPWNVLKLAAFAKKTHRRRAPFELQDLECATLVHRSIEGSITIAEDSVIECLCGERFQHRERIYAGEMLVAHQHESARKIAFARRLMEKSDELLTAQREKNTAGK